MYKTSQSNFGVQELFYALVCGATDTESMHETISAFYGPEKYFRLNPALDKDYEIDEKDRATLLKLQRMGKEYAANYSEDDLARLGKILKGQ